MFERIKDCICHPRYLGKYNKDSVGILLLTILCFFLLFAGVLAARCFTTPSFDETSASIIASEIIQQKEYEVSYDSAGHKLIGETVILQGEDYQLIVLPQERPSLKSNQINIILYETMAEVYQGSYKISSIDYEGIKVADFNFKEIKRNDARDTYYFKIFILDVLYSSNVFFQTASFLQELGFAVVFYFICLFFSTVLSIAVNPTIDKGVRIKLCAYDGCIFFIASFFIYLFNIGLSTYYLAIFPMIYTLITFKHIIKVVIRK
ncbi:MAG: hypothetical protein K2P14_07785 [Anaeroplasmataceae bacterium]|nr:hypothetical protein [Anaeroplasmataceae bacterium]